MWAAGALRRQVPADATASQLGVTVASMLPLLPDDRAQASPDPLVKLVQHRGGLAEAEVTTPSDKISGEFLDDLPGAFPTRAPRQLADLCLEAVNGLRRDPAPELPPTRKAEAQELADARLGDRALGLVDLEPETLGEELLDADHHPLACPLTAHIDVAVVGIAHKAVAALFQLLIQHVQHKVRQ